MTHKTQPTVGATGTGTSGTALRWIGGVTQGKSTLSLPFPEGVSCMRRAAGTILEFDPLAVYRWPTAGPEGQR